MLHLRSNFTRQSIALAVLFLSITAISAGQPWDSITSYSLPQLGSSPYGITQGPDGAVWFTEEDTNYIGRISASGVITQFPVYDAYAPTAITSGPDGALWFIAEFGEEIASITTSGLVKSISCHAV
jgi:virginiamycin B lyase